jgi:hypothetical protein
MSWTLVLNLATFLSSIAAVAGVIVALRVYRRQVNAQVFVSYTGRYEEIMNAFPTAGRVARLELDSAPPPVSEDLTIAVLRYLNLCSEEYYLCKSGHLERKLWSIWAAELSRMIRSPLMKREWVNLRPEFQSYPEFLMFVDQLQSKT